MTHPAELIDLPVTKNVLGVIPSSRCNQDSAVKTKSVHFGWDGPRFKLVSVTVTSDESPWAHGPQGVPMLHWKSLGCLLKQPTNIICLSHWLAHTEKHPLAVLTSLPKAPSPCQPKSASCCPDLLPSNPWEDRVARERCVLLLSVSKRSVASNRKIQRTVFKS